jgi:hypothetical protein
MKTSVKTRIVALVASIFVTFGTVYLAAEYAYPEAHPVVLLASAAH